MNLKFKVFKRYSMDLDNPFFSNHVLNFNYLAIKCENFKFIIYLYFYYKYYLTFFLVLRLCCY